MPNPEERAGSGNVNVEKLEDYVDPSRPVGQDCTSRSADREDQVGSSGET